MLSPVCALSDQSCGETPDRDMNDRRLRARVDFTKAMPCPQRTLMLQI